MENSAKIDIGGKSISLEQKTNYPWDGRVEINVSPASKLEFSVFVRIPGWTVNPEIRINGEKLDIEAVPGTYAKISRLWTPDDTIRLECPMLIAKMVSNPRVTSNNGCIALMRGPLIYCIEETDHKGIDIFSIALPHNSELKSQFEPDLLGGVVLIHGKALSKTLSKSLYTKIDNNRRKQKTIELTAVPYFSWANRKAGAMRVWLPK